MRAWLGLTGLVTIGAAFVAGASGCDASAAADGSGSGDGADSGAPPAPGLTAAQAEPICTAMWTARCQSLETCSPNEIAFQYGDVATCIARNVLACESLLALPGTVVTEAQGKACADDAAARACDDAAPLAACNFAGALEDGRACVAGNQCQSAFCAAPTSGARCGTCARDPRHAKVGEACEKDLDCLAWSACGSDAKCAPAGLAKGQPCAPGDVCKESLGLACEINAGVCEQITSVAETGAACPVDDAAKTAVACKDGLCDPTKKICLARSKEGEPCDPISRFCAYPYVCHAGACAAPQPFDYGTCQSG